MASQSEVREIDQENAVKAKRRFDKRDWDYIASFVIEEWERRKRERGDRERQWKEIDRQIAMEPDIAFKKMPNGEIDNKKRWMAEMELPLQAQALEVLTADARRMMFPDSGPWFRAHGEMTDEYLEKVDFKAIIKGDQAEVPSQMNQDNVDKLTEGFLLHMFRQYDLRTRMDRINAESFKYAMGVGRARMETKSIFIDEARGVRKETHRIPVIVPVSIKHLYLDDCKPSMHTSQMLGPAHIAHDWIKIENIALAANKGSNNPKDHDGGWMPDNIKGLLPDENGYVQILEMEGDIVVPRKTTRSVVIPGAIVTVALGGKDTGGNATRGVIRCRFRKFPFSSYLLFPYHYEGTDDTYAASPLMKGRPVQIMCVDALNRLMDSAALKNAPPVSYDRSDQTFAANGGPEIYPTALWGTTDPSSLKAHTEIGGEPAALSNVFTMGVNLYAELTGVMPARLGAQTVSHTTAFAKDAELQRGAVRTVDYVRQAGDGPLTRWLDMAYQMGRDSIGKESVSFFIDAYGGFVEIGKDHLPEKAMFDWFGSGGPAEEAQKKQMRLQAAMMAVQFDTMDAQTGGTSDIDRRKLKEAILREGGWTDLDAIMRTDTATAPSPAQPAIAMTALQQLAGPTQ